MKARVLERIMEIVEGGEPLQLVDYPDPTPQHGEILLETSVSDVCYTDLDEIEGRTAPPHMPVIPGHEVIGRVVGMGSGAARFKPGDRVGVGGIHSSTGAADENLSPAFRATGRDVDGGYAEFMTVPEIYAYPIPDGFDDAEAAPLLCAGEVGYRALKLSGIGDRHRLGLTGFGGSAHIVLQDVRQLYPNTEIAVFAHDPASPDFARSLGAHWIGVIEDPAPEPLDAIIDTTPAWLPVVSALSNLKPGGRLVVNAIRKEDRDKVSLQGLNYHDHLWMEKEIKSVANVTHHDLAEFLPLAAAAGIRPEIETYPLESANRALAEFKHRPVRGAKVLQIRSR